MLLLLWRRLGLRRHGQLVRLLRVEHHLLICPLRKLSIGIKHLRGLSIGTTLGVRMLGVHLRWWWLLLWMRVMLWIELHRWEVARARLAVGDVHLVHARHMPRRGGLLRVGVAVGWLGVCVGRLALLCDGTCRVGWISVAVGSLLPIVHIFRPVVGGNECHRGLVRRRLYGRRRRRAAF